MTKGERSLERKKQKRHKLERYRLERQNPESQKLLQKDKKRITQGRKKKIKKKQS